MWQYIQAAYSAPSFTESSPTDAAIVAHYRRWAASSQLSMHQSPASGSAKDKSTPRPLSLAASSASEVLERARERTSSAPMPMPAGSAAGSATGAGVGATREFAQTERSSRSTANGNGQWSVGSSASQAQGPSPPTHSIGALARQGDAAAAVAAMWASNSSSAVQQEQMATGPTSTIRSLARDSELVHAVNHAKETQAARPKQTFGANGQSQAPTRDGMRHRLEPQQQQQQERLNNSQATERQQLAAKPNHYEDPEVEAYLLLHSGSSDEPPAALQFGSGSVSPPKYVKNQQHAPFRVPAAAGVARDQTYVATATFNNRTRDAGIDPMPLSPPTPRTPSPENDHYNHKPTIPNARPPGGSSVTPKLMSPNGQPVAAVGASAQRAARRERDATEVDGVGVGNGIGSQEMAPRLSRHRTDSSREEASSRPPPPIAPTRSRSTAQRTRAPGFYDWTLGEPLRANAGSSSGARRGGGSSSSGSREVSTQVPRARHASTSTGGGEADDTETAAEVDSRSARSLRGVKRELLRRRREGAKDEEQLEERVERERTERVMTPRSARDTGVEAPGNKPKPRPLPLPHRWNASTDTVDLKTTLEELGREWAAQEQSRGQPRQQPFVSGGSGGGGLEELDGAARDTVPYEPDPRYRLVFPEQRPPNTKRAPSPPLGLGTSSGEFVEPKYSQWSMPSAHRVATMVGALEALTTAKHERQVLERSQRSRSTTDLSAVGLEVGPDDDTRAVGRRWGRYDEDYEDETAATIAEQPLPARSYPPNNAAEQARYGYAYAYETRPAAGDAARRLSVGSIGVLTRGMASREVGAVRVTEGPVVVQSSSAGSRGAPAPVGAQQRRGVSRGTQHQSHEAREARDQSVGRNDVRTARPMEQQQQRTPAAAVREYVHHYEFF